MFMLAIKQFPSRVNKVEKVTEGPDSYTGKGSIARERAPESIELTGSQRTSPEIFLIVA